MKKYVIKNCSASVEYSNGAGKLIYCSCEDKLCENINDCTIKQIVELCGKVECDCIIEKRKCGAMDSMSMCCELFKNKNILRLLEIEEVE